MVACWACDGGGGLLAFDGGDELAGLNVVAFFDVEVGDATEGGGADVDVGLGLDLAGAVDDGDEILAIHLGSGHLGYRRLTVEDGTNDDSGQNENRNDNQNNFLRAHCCFLFASPARNGARIWDIFKLL